ncbi:precorrin-3B synthase [Fischerella sp. JS2]|uniref:precorrin-3B synthase n=1 Tax=Fischerella sp. JS2 TaxID=2597771 RepID=UPI0028E909CC|nr:precorrin-3B synthase [Fischerella sp. JS2]
MYLSSISVPCPGVFYSTSARDGTLFRIRIPGGIVTTGQFRIVADLAEKFGAGYVNITNRANLQIREVRTQITSEVLHLLQDIGLASPTPGVDHLRNIMGSPTAGIDSEELIDTRSLIRKLDHYISSHAELAPLSPKFSIAIDGGGALKVCDRPNDIILTAVELGTQIYFHLKLNLGESFTNTSILLQPQECIDVVGAIAKVYLQHSAIKKENVTPYRKSPKIRLFEVLHNLGIERFLQEVESHLSYPLLRLPHSLGGLEIASSHPHLTRYLHLGVHPQRQQELSYIGVVLPLGKLETWQIQGLADIAQGYGSGTLRLTPWLNLLLTDIPQQYIHEVKSKIENLNLHWSATKIYSALVACAGSTGCASSATDTKNHALKLAEYLDQRVSLNQPVNIHFTGCPKSCAQHNNSDITLLGVSEDKYQVHVGDSDHESKFGRVLYQAVHFPQLPPLIEKILQVYIAKRLTRHESLREFANRHSIAQLQRMVEEGGEV